MNLPGETPGSKLVETEAGLIVPADAIPAAEPQPAQPARPTWPDTVPTDPDGRRRIVLTGDDRRTINRAVRVLQAAGLGIIVGCRGICGGVMTNEGRPKDGEADLDSGYGCGCSRVHFR